MMVMSNARITSKIARMPSREPKRRDAVQTRAALLAAEDQPEPAAWPWPYAELDVEPAAAQAPSAQAFLDGVEDGCVVDMAALEYISSAGLGVLLRTHKRLAGAGGGLELCNVNAHISDIFSYSGFDRLFVIRNR